MLRLFSSIIIALSLLAVPVFAGMDNCVSLPSHQHVASSEQQTDPTESVAHVVLHCCSAHAVAMPSRDHSVRQVTRINLPVPSDLGGRAALNPSPLFEPPSLA